MPLYALTTYRERTSGMGYLQQRTYSVVAFCVQLPWYAIRGLESSIVTFSLAMLHGRRSTSAWRKEGGEDRQGRGGLRTVRTAGQVGDGSQGVYIKSQLGRALGR